MTPGGAHFQRSVREQIARNLRRTPAERFQALFDLLESVEALSPAGPEAEARLARARARSEREREQMRAHLRRLIATGQADPPPGV